MAPGNSFFLSFVSFPSFFIISIAIEIVCIGIIADYSPKHITSDSNLGTTARVLSVLAKMEHFTFLDLERGIKYELTFYCYYFYLRQSIDFLDHRHINC